MFAQSITLPDIIFVTATIIARDTNRMKVISKPKIIEPTEDELKDKLLEELRKEPLSIISLAAMYAKGFQDTGEDVTKIYQTAEDQWAAMQKIYNKGYEDGYKNHAPFTVNVIIGGDKNDSI